MSCPFWVFYTLVVTGPNCGERVTEREVEDIAEFFEDLRMVKSRHPAEPLFGEGRA